MPNISETSVSDISLSPACSVMIIFFLGWYWGHNGAFESPWLERRRQQDAVVVSAVSASVRVDRSRASHCTPSVVRSGDSASVVEVARRFGMSSGQDVSVKGLKS